jgi:hypothetical protein
MTVYFSNFKSPQTENKLQKWVGIILPGLTKEKFCWFQPDKLGKCVGNFIFYATGIYVARLSSCKAASRSYELINAISQVSLNKISNYKTEITAVGDPLC